MIRQNTEEWLEARRGKITASKIFCLVNTVNADSALPKGAKTYGHGLLAQRLGTPITELQLSVLEYGKDQEECAVKIYEKKTKTVVFPGSFKTHPKYDFIGASPDGLIYKNDDVLNKIVKGVEIKCHINEYKHVSYMTGDDIPKEYEAQIQLNMWVQGVDSWDFVSYHPNFGDKSFYVRTIKANKKYQEMLVHRAVMLESFIEDNLSVINGKTDFSEVH